MSALDLAANYKELGKKVEAHAKEEFDALGLKVSNFVIENLSLPEEVEKMLDERTKMGVIGDQMGTYTQYKAANAMGDAAKNPAGTGLAGMGIGLGAGVGMGEIFTESIQSAKNKPRTRAIECIKCGVKIPGKSKFCPECGATQALSCAKCGEPITKGSKFCANCGEKLQNSGKVCPKCGKELAPNAKFCPDCGEKVK